MSFSAAPARAPRWVVSLAWFVGTFAVLGGGVYFWKSQQGPQAATPTAPAIGLRELLGVPIDEEVAVTGFVFVDRDERVLFCPERTRGEPAFCEGIAITVVGLDVSRLDLRRGETPSGKPWAWSAGEVTLLGTHRGPVFFAEDVLPS